MTNPDERHETRSWLVLLLLPLIALAFRRGVLLIILLLLLPFPPDASAFGWDELWKNRDQRGSLLFEQGAHDQAAIQFDDPNWKASSLYRAGKYDRALEYWNSGDTEDSLYNQGNALAKTGRYEDAIKAYQQVLDQNPQHQDASYNKQLLEEILKQQQQQESQESQDQANNDTQNSNDSSQDQNSGDNQQETQSDSESASSQQQQSQQDSAAQQDQKQESDGSETQAQEADQPRPDENNNAEAETQAELDEQMSEQAANQWLRKIPDDPGGLLRRKFIYQYKNRRPAEAELNQW